MQATISGDKYRQLESIFTWEEDIQYLAGRPGYLPSIGAQHRKAKRKLAHQWISALLNDFESLYDEALLLIVKSDIDRPDLVRALWRLRFDFYKGVVLLKFRLFCRIRITGEVRLLSTVFENLIGYAFIAQSENMSAYSG